MKKEEMVVTDQAAPSTSASGGVAPMSAVPNAPVMNPESVEGAGMGGIGQAAKDSARRTAAGAGNPAGMGGDASVEGPE